MVNLGKASLHKGGAHWPPPLRESFMEAGFPKVNQRKLLGFPKGPGTQGPGTQKYCRYGPWDSRILMEFPNYREADET